MNEFINQVNALAFFSATFIYVMVVFLIVKAKTLEKKKSRIAMVCVIGLAAVGISCQVMSMWAFNGWSFVFISLAAGLVQRVLSSTIAMIAMIAMAAVSLAMPRHKKSVYQHR